ncbi:hypothetical protein [Nonomuraea cavernae]|uniref:Endonuclease/exonuclease/phosphatase family protein n=1 Tax=Nonomuraea cavernae TaxID=2045107 RepID=A0A918DKP9_9ACTN|nr:hypothetical protein [Nonomuraea cavernae]MCA2188026.1 hypothetical protein [Nonomuraea cavernae]GGO72589.1 hypothetical protein GCM10012289_40940 [Nonomuraea cavernae]
MKRVLLTLGLIVAFAAVPAPGAGAAPAAAAAAVTPPVITVRAPAGAAPKAIPLAVTAKIHHYNICNAADGDPCTRAQADTAESILVWNAVADGAWFVSVNEICQDAFARLTTALKSDGTMVISKRQEADCGGKGYGNAIIHPGGVKVDGKAWYFPTQEVGKDCSQATTECRTGLCLKLTTYAGPMAQCTAHLGAGSTERTVTESAEYLWIARSYVEPGRRMSLAGDFNLTPGQLHPAYDELADLVLGFTHDTRDGLNRQIDYIFVERVGSWTARPAFCTDLAKQASDHCATSGEWHL